MIDDGDQNAIRILLNDQATTQNRVASARHLENIETAESFDALHDLARSPQEEDVLLKAAGRSLAKVAAALGREGDVEDLNPVAHAAYRS